MILKVMELETHHNNIKSRSWHFDNDIKVPIVMWLQCTSMISLFLLSQLMS